LRERLRIEVARDGNAAINMLDQEGRLRSSLGPHGISFYDDSGRMRTTLMSDLLYMSDERAHEIAHIQADPSGSQLKLTESGQQKWCGRGSRNRRCLMVVGRAASCSIDAPRPTTNGERPTTARGRSEILLRVL